MQTSFIQAIFNSPRAYLRYNSNRQNYTRILERVPIPWIFLASDTDFENWNKALTIFFLFFFFIIALISKRLNWILLRIVLKDFSIFFAKISKVVSISGIAKNASSSLSLFKRNMITVCIYLMRASKDETGGGSTHLSPEGLSYTSPTSWQRWLLGVPWQPDTPWARPTYPSCWGRRGLSSRPSARWLFAGYLRRCSHLLVIGMHQAFLCNRARDRSVSIVRRRLYNRLLAVSSVVRSIRRYTWFRLHIDTFTRVNFLSYKNLFYIVLHL